MRLRDSIALTLPSFLLRLVLGMTFIWAGMGKLMGTMEVSGADAARLANMGVVLDPVSSPPPPAAEQPQADPEPEQPLPEPNPAEDSQTPAEQTEDESDDLENQAEQIVDTIKKATQPGTSADEPPSDPESPETGNETGAETDTQTDTRIGRQIQTGPRITHAQNGSGDRAAIDFPEPMECQRVYSIALMISKAADPGLTADSQPIRPIMPPKLANGHWPKTLAWAAAITEIVAGGFLLLGLLTRISALGTFSVMLVAMWMTQIGPAALHSTDAYLGFIPNNQPWYDPGSYANLLWQIALASMSLAVVFLGSGAIGLDRLFFSSHPRDPYLHGDPKTSKKTATNPAAAQRSEFDRSPAS